MNNYIRENFQYTGKAVPVDSDASSQHVIALLDEYNKRVKVGEKPDVDPFRENIVFKTNNNIFYEIPEEIQRKAIQMWLSKHPQRLKQRSGQRANINKKQNNNTSNIILYVIVVVLMMTCGYFIVKNKSNY